MFAIDGVKLPSNASKERSGTHEELRYRADRLEKAADKIMALHQAQDKRGADDALEPKHQARIEALRKEAARTREFLASTPQRLNRKGQELKTNVTDPQSAKMATNKGVIQGYAAQAAVDSAHQVIVAADVIGSGSEQAMLLPMIAQSQPYREEHTLITVDNQMRKRDERFETQSKYKDKPDTLSEKTPTGQPKEVKRFAPGD